jgi:hypothetical protein
MFDLVGSLSAIGAPGHDVLMYRPPDHLARAALRIIDAHEWLHVEDDLWICSDETHLLFAHNDPTVSELVGA